MRICRTGRNVSHMGNTTRIEDVAVNILSILQNQKRSVRWLAAETQIKYSTLYHQLHNRPKNLSHLSVLAIAEALGVDELAFSEHEDVAA